MFLVEEAEHVIHKQPAQTEHVLLALTPQVCQLMLQWQQWEVEQGHEAVFAMSEQRDAQLAGEWACDALH